MTLVATFLLVACGEGVRGGDGPRGVSAVIGMAGGTISFRGVSLTLSAGALDQDTTIMVFRTPDPGGPALDSIIDLKPPLLRLQRPAMLSAAFVVPEGRTAQDVTLGVLSGSSWRPVTGAQLTADNWVSATIVQLSTYAPVAACGNNQQCPSLRCESGVCQ
jgi:hypothetical protein